MKICSQMIDRTSHSILTPIFHQHSKSNAIISNATRKKKTKNQFYLTPNRD